jgi:two-component system, OmpR family, sensor histidine kinase KdpD
VGKELLSLPAAEQFLSGVLPEASRQDYAYQLIRVDLLDEIAQIMIRQLAKTFTEPAFVLFPSADGELRVWARSQPESRLTNEEHGAARWVFENGEPAGSGTQTLYGIKTYFEPVKAEKTALGVVGIQMDVGDMMPEQRQLLGALINLASLSVARLA